MPIRNPGSAHNDIVDGSNLMDVNTIFTAPGDTVAGLDNDPAAILTD